LCLHLELEKRAGRHRQQHQVWLLLAKAMMVAEVACWLVVQEEAEAFHHQHLAWLVHWCCFLPAVHV